MVARRPLYAIFDVCVNGGLWCLVTYETVTLSIMLAQDIVVAYSVYVIHRTPVAACFY